MNIRKKILICPNTKLQKVIVNSSMEIKFNLMTYHVTSNSRRPTGEQAHQIFQFALIAGQISPFYSNNETIYRLSIYLFQSRQSINCWRFVIMNEKKITREQKSFLVINRLVNIQNFPVQKISNFIFVPTRNRIDNLWLGFISLSTSMYFFWCLMFSTTSPANSVRPTITLFIKGCFKVTPLRR